MIHSTPVFEPIENKTIVEAVLDHVEMLIIEGVLRQGMKLPSERDLAQQMSVSREKVRAALKRLEEQDLIMARPGDGTYIAPLIGPALSPALVNLFARHQAGFQDYLEFRREIEGFAAELATERATESDQHALRDSLERQKDALASGNREKMLREDIEFHALIIDASHNAMMTHTMASIYEMTERGIFHNRAVIGGGDKVNAELINQHEMIVNAVVEGDKAKARTASDAHIDYVGACILEGLASDKREILSAKRRSLAK